MISWQVPSAASTSSTGLAALSCPPSSGGSSMGMGEKSRIFASQRTSSIHSAWARNTTLDVCGLAWIPPMVLVSACFTSACDIARLPLLVVMFGRAAEPLVAARMTIKGEGARGNSRDYVVAA